MGHHQLAYLPNYLSTTKETEKKIQIYTSLISSKFTQKYKPKPKPQASKDDYVHICDIKEHTYIELFLDELEEVRGISAYRQLLERLVFKYKEMWKGLGLFKEF